ncbi:MAG: glycosyl hydrolase-related protein [Tannerellaceae bacterium]|jgi:alpha-mannosidase|nr:glycosyl hydrolase-related protein [Tannerellaceae bacterium]
MKLKFYVPLCAILLCYTGIQAQDAPYFKEGRLYIVNSSHQDIAWMDSPDECIRFRDEQMITPALQRLAESKQYCFSVEDALSLREYLERHPDSYSAILKYTKEGRLEWGATNKQPYPSMYDGEALVRQTYFGRKWLQKVLPGCDFRTAYNEDVPGMALQLPQILSKSGIPYYQISRHQPGFYKWFSPDGSSVLTWSPGQYYEKTMPILHAPSEAARTDTLIRFLDEFDGYYRQRNIPPVRLVLYSFDFSKPVDWDNYMEDWNNEAKGANPRGLPYIMYSTSTRAMDEIAASKDVRFDELLGERPNVWLYIHGPAHQRALKAGREASRLLTAAEKFSAFNALVENSFSSYPANELTGAWEAAIYPDHGWGGNKGAITDRYFRDKFEFARDKARELLDKSLRSIAQRIRFKDEYKQAVTVFNPLSWERTDPVVLTLDVEGRADTHYKLVDAGGNEIPYQFTDCPYTGKKDEVITITFIAEKVPALGYKTYYLTEGDLPAGNEHIPSPVPAYENKYYRVVLGHGGIESLYDKELKKEFFRSDKFSGGELFTLQSVGNGAGEFTDIQQPTMEGFDQLRNYKQQWQCVETGAVRDVFQTVQPLRETQAVLRIALYKTIKRIDVEVDLNRFNGENWREFRLAFPLNMQQAKVAYEVPMGVVEVGKDEIEGAAGYSKATQIYSTPCKKVHPREVQDWFAASDGKAGLVISSDVAVFDWIDPTDRPADYVILQPVLLASRKSCHGLGNYYLQPGNHSYRFSIYTHAGDWHNGYKNGVQSRQTLKPIVTGTEKQQGFLPEQQCFGTLAGQGAIVSTVKKCEDDDSLILRYYNIEGNDAEVTFGLFREIESVSRTNLIEEEPVTVKSSAKGFSYKLGHHAIETFKIGIK